MTSAILFFSLVSATIGHLSPRSSISFSSLHLFLDCLSFPFSVVFFRSFLTSSHLISPHLILYSFLFSFLSIFLSSPLFCSVSVSSSFFPFLLFSSLPISAALVLLLVVCLGVLRIEEKRREEQEEEREPKKEKEEEKMKEGKKGETKKGKRREERGEKRNGKGKR